MIVCFQSSACTVHRGWSRISFIAGGDRTTQCHDAEKRSLYCYQNENFQSYSSRGMATILGKNLNNLSWWGIDLFLYLRTFPNVWQKTTLIWWRHVSIHVLKCSLYVTWKFHLVLWNFEFQARFGLACRPMVRNERFTRERQNGDKYEISFFVLSL